MKINKITLRNLRNDTHFQFHTEFKDLAQKHNPAAMKIASQYGAYPNMRLLLPHRWVGCIRKRAGGKVRQLEVLMNKMVSKVALAAGVVLAMAFIFSCSSIADEPPNPNGSISSSSSFEPPSSSSSDAAPVGPVSYGGRQGLRLFS